MRQHLGQTLRNPYLWNHWMDLYHFEFYGIVLTCSCATSWSFDLDLGFSRSNFENAVSQEWKGRLTWNERDVNRYDVTPTLWLSTFPSPMTLTLDFQGQILKRSYLRNGMTIDMELKGCESIECWTHAVTFNGHLTHDLYFGFSRSNFEKVVSQEWDGRLTWNERDVSR